MLLVLAQRGLRPHRFHSNTLSCRLIWGSGAGDSSVGPLIAPGLGAAAPGPSLEAACVCLVGQSLSEAAVAGLVGQSFSGAAAAGLDDQSCSGACLVGQSFLAKTCDYVVAGFSVAPSIASELGAAAHGPSFAGIVGQSLLAIAGDSADAGLAGQSFIALRSFSTPAPQREATSQIVLQRKTKVPTPK